MARVGRFEIRGRVGAFEIVTYLGRRAPGGFELSCIELRDAEVIESVVGVLGRPGAQDGFESHGECARVVVGRDRTSEFSRKCAVRCALPVGELVSFREVDRVD